MEDLDLPPSVASSDVELPPSVLGSHDEEATSGSKAGHCNCKLGCAERFESTEIEQHRSQTLSLSESDRAEAHFNAVRLQVCDKDGAVEVGYTKFTICGQRVCRTFWEYYHAIGHDTLDKYKNFIRNGATSLPSKSPRMPGVRTPAEFAKADAWFFQMHQDLGEPLLWLIWHCWILKIISYWSALNIHSGLSTSALGRRGMPQNATSTPGVSRTFGSCTSASQIPRTKSPSPR